MTKFEIEGYLGVWWEVARYPNYFEQGAAFASAFYFPIVGGIGVLNTSFDQNCRPISRILGRAVQVKGTTLAVKFPVATAWAEYKIEWVSDSYVYAIVGNTAKSQLWILARGTITWGEYVELRRICNSFGYDQKRLITNMDLIF